MIAFYEEDAKAKLTQKLTIRRWIKAVIDTYHAKPGDINYIFCSDEYILDVNRQYLNHDYFTDVITFDYVEDGIISGDIYISVDTVASNAALYNTTYIDELHRVVIHGVLHLCGIKDKTDEDAAIMRAAEEKALAMLKEMLN